MSHIYAKDLTWYISFYFKRKQYKKSLGIRARLKKQSKTTINKAVALEKQMEIDVDLKQGVYPTYFTKVQIHEISLHDFLDEFEVFTKDQTHHYGKNSQDHYKYAFKRIKKALPVDMPLQDMNKKIIDKQLITYLHRNYAYNTVRGTLIDLKAALNCAMEWEYIAKNPLEGVSTKRKKTIPKFYKLEEIDKMRDYFDRPDIPDWQGDIVFLILNTALRKEEAVNLTWENIYWDLEAAIFPGKGREGIIPLNDAALKILRNRPQSPKKNIRVFWEINTISAFNSAFRRMKDRTELGGNIHQLRKSYASHFAMQDGPLLKLKDNMRHEDMSTVLVYAALSKKSLSDSKNTVNFPRHTNNVEYTNSALKK
jgi:integrase